MKENRKLLREVLNDIRHDMTDEEVLNLLADSKISVKVSAILAKQLEMEKQLQGESKMDEQKPQ